MMPIKSFSYTLLLTLSLLFIFGSVKIAPAFASHHIERISVGNTPLPAEQESDSGFPAINLDGRYVVFQSANSYFPTVQNCDGLYLRDRLTATTEQINLNTDGTELCETEDPYSINSTGQFVVFAVNRNSIYVRDRNTSTTELISVADDGTPGNGMSGNPSISADGRYVLFVSESTNFEPTLTPGTPNGNFYLYQRDRLLQTTRLVSFDHNGTVVRAQFLENELSSISNDNRYISWFSPEDGAYLRDLQTNTTTQLSPGGDIRLYSSVNGGGTIIVFNTGTQISVYDIATQTTEVLPLNVSNVYRSDVSDDGRYIVFPSNSAELTGVILYDRVLQTTTVLSGNPQIFDGEESVISADGRFVSFESFDQILSEDMNTALDVYILDITALPSSGPTTVTFTSVADTFVRTTYENQNEGSSPFFKINDIGNSRSLIRFDQSDLLSQIADKSITTAKLRLSITNNEGGWGSDGRGVDVHAVTKNWTEGNGTQDDRGTGTGATWNCAIDANITNTNKNCSGATEWHMGPDGNRPWVSTATDGINFRNTTNGVVEFDVTSDVQAFLNGSKENYGWIVKKRNEAQSGTAFFSSKEGINPPQLIITYQP